jgi:hypothetical protein
MLDMLYESSCRPSAAEFPHDNPLFDRCALWDRSALEFTGPPEPEREIEVAAATANLEETATATEAAIATETPTEAATETVTETATETPTATEAATKSVAVTASEAATEAAIATESPIETETATPTVIATATEPTTATPTTAESPPPIEADAADPIVAFVAAVTEVALVHGPAETAGHIESLFTFGTLDSEALSETAQAALFEGKILVRTDDGVRTTEAFASTRIAWQSILRGESGDLSACGESTLDTWTADLVARLIAHPDKAQTIRRDLRRRGIAAFGMLS